MTCKGEVTTVADYPGRPIVILGGFLSFAMLYCDMAEALERLTGQPVFLVEAQTLDWLPVIAPPGWRRLLDKVDRAVQQARQASATGQVTLIGHSAGGLLARLYLSPRPFLGRSYRGLETVADLITLGTPHYNRRKFIYGGWLASWVDRRYPGAYFAPQVRYTAVAGKWLQGNLQGTRRERQVYLLYKDMLGDGAIWGDGLVPVASALLQGARQITLEAVSHYAVFGAAWYGAPEVIPRWWYAERDDTPAEQTQP